MPELPDIRLYVSALKDRIAGQTLLGIRIANPFVLRSVSPRPAELAGLSVVDVSHLAKRLVIELEGRHYVVIHLMIAGRLQWKPTAAPLRGRSQLAAMDFDNGSLILTEAGTRRRAAVQLVAGEEELRALDRGGLDPLDVSLAPFRERLMRENHTLKRALTDQRLLAGIGNAYSDEILFAARLSPFKQTHSLSDEEWARLHDAMQSTLQHWVDQLQQQTAGEFPTKVTAFRPEMAVHGRYPDFGDSTDRAA